MSEDMEKAEQNQGLRVLRIGSWLTAVWVIVSILIMSSGKTCPVDDASSPAPFFWSCLEPNAIGDSLAGLFAPLAFFWLVVAVFLQFHELRGQEEAMLRQVAEVQAQNSVSHLNFFREVWNTEPILRARLLVVQETDLTKTDLKPHEDVLLNFMEDLATVSLLNLATMEHVWSYYSYYFEGYWAILGPKVHCYRDKTSDPTFFKNIEVLHKKFSEINIDHGAPVSLAESYLNEFKEEEKGAVQFYLESQKG